jgi:hypothetical protein
MYVMERKIMNKWYLKLFRKLLSASSHSPAHIWQKYGWMEGLSSKIEGRFYCGFTRKIFHAV